MNARMKLVGRNCASLYVISHDRAGGSLELKNWIRLRRKLKRVSLLLRSPVASFRWAVAKCKAAPGKRQAGISGWQGRRSNNFAECEKDGIVMGF
jgi:hypothetical protein